MRLGYACQSNANAHARAVAADAPDVPSVASCIGAAVSFDHGEPPVSDEDPRAPAAEQAALRRVATMVARGVPPEEVFAAVTKEVGRLIGVDYAGLNRYEADGTTMTIVSVWSRAGGQVRPGGTRQILGGKNISTIVFETGRAAQIDGYTDSSGPLGLSAVDYGIGSGLGTPLVVEGRLWGVMSVFSKPGQPLPPDAGARLASFTELVVTAIANAESRAGLARLAEEQAALRRVATFVARGIPEDELFAAVTEEIGPLLGAEYAFMGRYEPDGTLVVVGAWGADSEPRSGWQPAHPRRKEPRDDRLRDGSFCPDRRLRRCHRPTRCRRPGYGCPLGRRDSDHGRGPPVGDRGCGLAPGAVAAGR